MNRPSRVLALLAIASLGALSGCMVESHAAGSYYPTQTYGYGTTYGSTYGYSSVYAPSTVYYSGGYYNGSYFRPGYYHPSAPFVTVQPAPVQYGAPVYAPPRPVYGGGYGGGYGPGYAPGYAQPARPAYVAPAQPVYVPQQARPAYSVPVGGGGYGGAPMATPVGPRAGVPVR